MLKAYKLSEYFTVSTFYFEATETARTKNTGAEHLFFLTAIKGIKYFQENHKNRKTDWLSAKAFCMHELSESSLGVV